MGLQQRPMWHARCTHVAAHRERPELLELLRLLPLAEAPGWLQLASKALQIAAPLGDRASDPDACQQGPTDGFLGGLNEWGQARTVLSRLGAGQPDGLQGWCSVGRPGSTGGTATDTRSQHAANIGTGARTRARLRSAGRTDRQALQGQSRTYLATGGRRPSPPDSSSSSLLNTSS